MIGEMVAVLKAEQQDDDDKKEYCAKQFDLADDKQKALERSSYVCIYIYIYIYICILTRVDTGIYKHTLLIVFIWSVLLMWSSLLLLFMLVVLLILFMSIVCFRLNIHYASISKPSWKTSARSMLARTASKS